MGRTIKAQGNQTMMDVVIQALGTLEAGMQFAQDNNVALSDIPVAGTVYAISDAAWAMADQNALAVIQQQQVAFGNLNENPPVLPVVLGLTVVLYPASTVTINPGAPSAPSVLGYWDVIIKGVVGQFVHLYNLSSNFASDPDSLRYISKTRLLASDSWGTLAIYTTCSTIDEFIEYHVPWDANSNDGSEVFVQSAKFLGGLNTLEYEDVHTNEAIVAPFIVLDSASQTVIQGCVPALTATLRSSTGTNAIVALAMSHPAAASADWAHITLSLIDEAAAGGPDPLDPGNTDKCIVTLTPGLHKLGVQATYKYTDGVTVLGNSMIEMVIEIA